MFVVEDEDGGDAEQVADDVLRTGPVGQRQAWALTQEERQQLKGTDHDPAELHGQILAVMAPDPAEGQALLFGEVADLESVAGGQDRLMAPSFQLADDRDEKRNMRGVIQVDPDLHLWSEKALVLPLTDLGRQGPCPCFDHRLLIAGGCRRPPETGHLPGQGVPVPALVSRPDIFEELDIVLDRILFVPAAAPFEDHIIGMGIEGGHAAFLGDPVELLFPDPDILLPEDDKKPMVLGQGVRELYVRSCSGVVARHEGKDRAHPLRLRFERVRGERRAGILDIELGDPVQVVQHGRRRESDRAPPLEVIIDSRHLLAKAHGVPEQLSVMLETMDADFKTGLSQAPDDMRRGRIIFRHEVEGRPETLLPVNIHQLEGPFKSLQAVDIMIQNQGEILAFRPPCPASRRFRRGWIDRPRITHELPFACRDRPTDRDLEPSGDDRLYFVEKIYRLHLAGSESPFLIVVSRRFQGLRP
jgi:hypothetical protein